MKYLRIILLVSLVTVLTNCNKKNDGGGNSTADKPVNVAVAASISTDNSGNVTFTTSADNAVSYEIDFGNGTYQTITNGSVTYKYPVAGTYTVNVTAKSQSGKTTTKSIQVTVSAIEALIWSDEFDTPGAPDPSKWGYDLGGGGWGNSELEYYTNRTDNAVVSGGTLKIIAKKEAMGGMNFTSARILTKNKFAFTYGKIEVKAKLPTGGGSWPAIWMLGANVDTNPWPGCGEIDIMEHKGNDQNRIFATLHHPGHSGGNGDGSTVVINDATQWHVYALEWSAKTLIMSIDGKPFYTFTNAASLPFNKDFFIILNHAVGGTFGGAVDPAFTGGTMEVDYVRVYR